MTSAGNDAGAAIARARRSGNPPTPIGPACALALGLPLEADGSAPECATTLSAIEQAVHDLVDGNAGMSKRQLVAQVRGRWRRAAVLQAVEAGRRAGWLDLRTGPRRAHCLHLRCCGSLPLVRPSERMVEMPVEPRRPLDGYDALRLRMLVEVLRRLLGHRPQAVVRAYAEAWREVGAPRRACAEEGEVWQELADVEERLLQPLLAFLDEAEFLSADAACLLVDPMLRERVRDYGQAFCDACGQLHQLRRRR